MANRVTGTFSATGASDSVRGNRVAINLDFAGTATVDVQWDPLCAGNWKSINSFNEDISTVFDGPNVPVRLNCTAHTNNVTYSLEVY